MRFHGQLSQKFLIGFYRGRQPRKVLNSDRVMKKSGKKWLSFSLFPTIFFLLLTYLFLTYDCQQDDSIEHCKNMMTL